MLAILASVNGLDLLLAAATRCLSVAAPAAVVGIFASATSSQHRLPDCHRSTACSGIALGLCVSGLGPMVIRWIGLMTTSGDALIAFG